MISHMPDYRAATTKTLTMCARSYEIYRLNKMKLPGGFQIHFFPLAINCGLIDAENPGGLGDARGAFQDFADMKLLQLFQGY
jgi:hypothetical protein